jgi:hypothetical protein
MMGAGANDDGLAVDDYDFMCGKVKVSFPIQ